MGLITTVLSLLSLSSLSVSSAFVLRTTTTITTHSQYAPPTTALCSSRDNSSSEDTAKEALNSLADFHSGSWRGTFQSFTVSADVAAGILARTARKDYCVNVQLQSDRSWEETLQWLNNDNDNDVTVQESSRIIDFQKSNMDCDSVDGSYSLDVTFPDLPAAWINSEKLQQWAVEHCLAVSDNHRSRLLAIYSVTDQSLQRVVVCDETRIISPKAQESSDNTAAAAAADANKPNALTAVDMIEIQSDVDRLVDKIASRVKSESGNGASKVSSASEKANASAVKLPPTISAAELRAKLTSPDPPSDNGMSPHAVSLLELSSGVWLGDSIVRDLTPAATSNKGFGTAATKQNTPAFASWNVGVQKTTWRWMWNFGEEIRQLVAVGKAMGVPLIVPAPALGGQVCVNDGLSRRIKPEDRMVYVDWEGDNVGFLIGSTSIQLPRYLNFDRSRQRPFYTEFCVYQSSAPGDKAVDGVIDMEPQDVEPQLPEVHCSKISRVYNAEGMLQQGCTSFFTLNRFGMDDDDDTDAE